MADEEQLAILRSGVKQWNAWRRTHRDVLRPDLIEANLIGADLSGADLTRAYLVDADLSGSDLSKANLRRANLLEVNLTGADLSEADLTRATLEDAILFEADLADADLSEADLRGADLSGANLSGADLSQANLIKASFVNATLDGCTIYGISAWNVQLEGATQTNLRITPDDEPEITADNLEVAQFLYLMLHNEKIRQIIDTLTSKVVLILGRFTPERKAVLDALREALRQQQYVPVLFDFEGATERNFTETVTLLARMARFIVADITDPASIPQELQAIVTDVQVPVQPIIAEGVKPYAMFADFRRYPWMLKEYCYSDLDSLIAAIGNEIIAPAEAKVKELRGL